MVLNFVNFKNILNKITVFEKNAQIAVGVSGGVDSIVLIYLLSMWSKLYNFKVIALIIDHKIRPESTIEAKVVSSYLKNLNVNNKILTWRKHTLLKGIQEKARNARLRILHNYCNNNNIIHLILGHHKDDNLETYILRKVAGSNFEGLSSIKNLIILNNIQIIRPLLSFNKNEIINFANKSKLEWIEDPSNYNMDFSRSKIRSIFSKNKQIKKFTLKEYNKNASLYKEYITMINHNLALVLTRVTPKKVEIDKNLFLSLSQVVALKILAIILKNLKKNDYVSKYRKLRIIYSKIIKKSSKFRSQNAFFLINNDKITIWVN